MREGRVKNIWFALANPLEERLACWKKPWVTWNILFVFTFLSSYDYVAFPFSEHERNEEVIGREEGLSSFGYQGILNVISPEKQ